MSVIFYEAEELANLAVCAVGGSTASDYGRRSLARNVEILAAFARANQLAAIESYGDDPEFRLVTAEDIQTAAHVSRLPYPKRSAAIRTLTGLAYNAISQRGTDFLDGPTAKGLLTMAERFLHE
jgi:hypothetical protein